MHEGLFSQLPVYSGNTLMGLPTSNRGFRSRCARGTS